jgi:hypothetical protein
MVRGAGDCPGGPVGYAGTFLAYAPRGRKLHRDRMGAPSLGWGQAVAKTRVYNDFSKCRKNR